MQTSPTVHSKIGASSMHRWAKCPGSVRLSKDIPSKTSIYAEEGTLAHELAAKILLGEKHDVSIFSDEDLDAVMTYVNFVRESQKNASTTFIEQKFSLEQFHPNLFGTSDAVLYYESEKLLYVVDYKHGKGIPVEAKNNPQLMYYALGALSILNRPCERVVMTIVQPRCFHVEGTIRSFAISAWELLEFANDLVDYAKATEKEDAPLIPGEYCRFCPAANICPALESKVKEAVKLEFEVFKEDPVEVIQHLDINKLSNALHLIPLLKSWIANVEDTANFIAKSVKIPGFKMVDKRGTRKWINEEQAIDFLKSQKLNDEDIYKKDLKSPAQIEKILTKENKKLLTEFVMIESSGTTLVSDDDKRPELLPQGNTSILDDFSPI